MLLAFSIHHFSLKVSHSWHGLQIFDLCPASSHFVFSFLSFYSEVPVKPALLLAESLVWFCVVHVCFGSSRS